MCLLAWFSSVVLCVSPSIHGSGRKCGLYKENLLLRGCTIRNTEEAVGIVIYAGRHGNVSSIPFTSILSSCLLIPSPQLVTVYYLVYFIFPKDLKMCSGAKNRLGTAGPSTPYNHPMACYPAAI